MDLNGLPADVSRLCDPTAAPVCIKSSSSSWPRVSLLRRSLRTTKATPAIMIAPPTPTTTPMMVFRVPELIPELPDESPSSSPSPGAEVSGGLVSVESVVCSMISPFSVLVWVMITTDSDVVVGVGFLEVGFASEVVSGVEVGVSFGVEVVEGGVDSGVELVSSSFSEVVDSSLVVTVGGSDVGSGSLDSVVVGSALVSGDDVGSALDVGSSAVADGTACPDPDSESASSSSSKSCLRLWWWS